MEAPLEVVYCNRYNNYILPSLPSSDFLIKKEISIVFLN